MSEHEVVRKFIDQVRWLHAPEFGDFKRRLGMYIERLEESHPELLRESCQRVLAEMKSTVTFNPNGDMELTRQQVIQMAHELLDTPSGPLH